MNQDTPFIIGFGITLAGAAGSVAYLLNGGAHVALGTAAAVGLVGLGQISLLGLSLKGRSGQEETLHRVLRDVANLKSDLVRTLDQAMHRLTQSEDIGKQQGQAIETKLAGMNAAIHNLRQPLLETLHEAAAQAQLQHQQVRAQQVQAHEPRLEMPNSGPAAIVDEDDHIRFALEPIIQLQQQSTAHYRLHVAMQVAGGELSGEALLQNASQVGKRPKLDALAVHQALALLGKLRARDPNLSLLVNLGAETLSDDDVIAQIMKDCALARTAAQGLVFELPHASLSTLSNAALEGLAAFARAGIGFALSNASISSLEFSAMRMLNIRFVALSAQATAIARPGRLLAEFAGKAKLVGIQLIVTDVMDMGRIGDLVQIAELACGPCFAAPRRVKRMELNELDSEARVRLAA